MPPQMKNSLDLLEKISNVQVNSAAGQEDYHLLEFYNLPCQYRGNSIKQMLIVSEFLMLGTVSNQTKCPNLS